MGLSNKTISSFVKATKNDTSSNKKEKTVYGNMHIIYFNPDTKKEYNVAFDEKTEQLTYEDESGQTNIITDNKNLLYYVKIDGAEEGELTPVSKLATNVNPNQKAIVMIKDHIAVVTGNLTTPALETTQVRKEINRRLSQIETISEDDIDALWSSYE